MRHNLLFLSWFFLIFLISTGCSDSPEIIPETPIEEPDQEPTEEEPTEDEPIEEEPIEEICTIEIITPEEISSKDYWVEGCEITILNSNSEEINHFDKVSIKGRGNSTWVRPKKPYAIKLDKKAEIFGFPKHKRWVLLANYFDKTNLRTELAFFLGRLSNNQIQPGLEYTPRIKYVNLIMNGENVGLYQFTEQIKIDENRVNVGDDGFLLEVDMRAGSDPEDIYFKIPQIQNPIVIKDPDVVEGDENFNFISNFLQEAGDALFSESYMDEKIGYKKYLDVESFIDWYIVNEIGKNGDATFVSSCYMNLSKGGKLKMGPIWDFDVAFGNYPYGWTYEDRTQMINDPEGFFVMETPWFKQLFSDPEVLAKLKERFSYYYNKKDEVIAYIESMKYFISPMVIENDKIWNFYSNPFEIEVSQELFNEDCNDLIGWFNQRMNWLNTELNKL